MRLYIQEILFLFLLSSFVFAQEKGSDSSRRVYLYDSLLKLQTKLEEFDFYRGLNYLRLDLTVNSDTNTIWMWTKLSILNSGTTDFHPGKAPVNLVEPLHQQFMENSRLNPIRSVLGLAQTAAVGYLAYQHIKKYGFFK
jgi:hypothetical protein